MIALRLDPTLWGSVRNSYVLKMNYNFWSILPYGEEFHAMLSYIVRKNIDLSHSEISLQPRILKAMNLTLWGNESKV